ncbi:uncharacterized protein LOC124166356 [Ischnura elegans]|uniref:uncharacterized protein LOC124166356 n=1 Tax=Ischnura elegans TaxID=197161 RepID=UPI001ED8BF4F|nr:uncharacterized protein LOC124166356 [Ischnura elegans]
MSPSVVFVVTLQAAFLFGAATTSQPGALDDTTTRSSAPNVTYIFKVDLGGGSVGSPSSHTAWSPPMSLVPRQRNLLCTDAELPSSGYAFCAHTVNYTESVTWTGLILAYELDDVGCIASFADYSRVPPTDIRKVEFSLTAVKCYSTAQHGQLTPFGVIDVRNALHDGTIPELSDRASRSLRIKDAAYAVLEGTRDQDLRTVVRFTNDSPVQGTEEDVLPAGQVEWSRVSPRRRIIVGRNFGENENCMFDSRGRCRLR